MHRVRSEATGAPDTGSALVLVPAVILVVVGLLVATVDVAHAHLRARGLEGEAAGIANDLATLGVDVEHFQSTGEVRLRAEHELASLADALTGRAITVRRVDDLTVEVTLRAAVPPLIGPTSALGTTSISSTVRGVADGRDP